MKKDVETTPLSLPPTLPRFFFLTNPLHDVRVKHRGFSRIDIQEPVTVVPCLTWTSRFLHCIVLFCAVLYSHNYDTLPIPATVHLTVRPSVLSVLSTGEKRENQIVDKESEESFVSAVKRLSEHLNLKKQEKQEKFTDDVGCPQAPVTFEFRRNFPTNSDDQRAAEPDTPTTTFG